MPRKTKGYATAGRPKGYRVSPATREKIKGAQIIDKLQNSVLNTAILEPHHVTAGLGLLKFQLPTLQATDITSGGEPLTVERVVFGKRRKGDGEEEAG